MLSGKWAALFDEAVTAHTSAVYWTNQEPHVREASAVTFRNLLCEFQIENATAFEILKNRLKSKDILQRNTAARLLIELPALEASAHLVADLYERKDPPLARVILRQLRLEAGIREKLWKDLPTFRLFEQISLLESLLHDPTEAGIEFVKHEIADSDVSVISHVVIKAIARWGMADLLWSIVNSPSPATSCEHPDQPTSDNKIEAAFYLALTGDLNALSFLERVSHGIDLMQAAEAVQRLAWLGWPGAIGMISKLLRATDMQAAALALNAASRLSAAALGPTLLDLAGGPAIDELELESPPLPDEAIRVLGHLTGHWLPDGMEDYVVGAIPDTFTEATRINAVTFYRKLLQDMNLAWRYYHGEPLTLRHLASDLLSPHDGPRTAASHNLRAITGEDHGFDPDSDLIANLPAIAAWRERANHPEPLNPGGWGFAGKSLPEPEML